MSDELSSVEQMLGGGPTAPLEEFRKAYALNGNLWWYVDGGHHQNLFEAACEEIDRLREQLRLAQHRARTNGEALADCRKGITRWPSET